MCPMALLRLKRKAPTTGYVDGAWWPRSDDLKVPRLACRAGAPQPDRAPRLNQMPSSEPAFMRDANGYPAVRR